MTDSLEGLSGQSLDDTVDVFISYASLDRSRVLPIADALESLGVRVWIDRNKILGGQNFSTEIVRAIRSCKVLALLCSDASMRSRNVKQEIQLAWKHKKPYLPLLLERISFPEQVEYFLEGWQWIEVLDHSQEQWLTQLIQSLKKSGIGCHSARQIHAAPADIAVEPTRPGDGLDGLYSVAKFTDLIWPLSAERAAHTTPRRTFRGLGAPQDDVRHIYPLGSRLCLAIESHRRGYLLLINEGANGIIYCLCPSWFAPDTFLNVGINYMPQEGSRYDSFVVTGCPGREHLLAIITEDPLGLDWMPADPHTPARVLNKADINTLLDKVRGLEPSRWTALSTYFEVTK